MVSFALFVGGAFIHFQNQTSKSHEKLCEDLMKKKQGTFWKTLTVLPNLESYKISVETIDVPHPLADQSVQVSFTLLEDPNRPVQFLHTLADECKPHTFIFPADYDLTKAELGAFQNVPLGRDPKFRSHIQVRLSRLAQNDEKRWKFSGQETELWDALTLYRKFAQIDALDDTFIGAAQSSIQGSVSFWEPITLDAKDDGFGEWLKKCSAGVVSSRELEQPQMYGDRGPVPAPAAASQIELIAKCLAEFKMELNSAIDDSDVDAELEAGFKQALESNSTLQDLLRTSKQICSEARTGQAQFRKEVLKRCDSRCIITGADVPEALEAAHLVAFADRRLIKANVMDPLNGVALRADLHRLFDSGLLAFRLCRGEDGNEFVKLHLHAKLRSYLPNMHGTVVERFPPAARKFLRAKLALQKDWPNKEDADEMEAVEPDLDAAVSSTIKQQKTVTPPAAAMAPAAVAAPAAAAAPAPTTKQ